MYNRKFISFEGGEGSGKSTQIKLLKEYLTTKQIDHIITREPGGTEIAEEIRQILTSGHHDKMMPMTELLLHVASRYEHVQQLILPALKNGKLVISDRFIDSTIAYQSYGHNLDLEIIKQLTDLTIGNLRPTLTFILDIDPEIGIKRAQNREDAKQYQHDNLNNELVYNIAEDRYEQFSLDFHHNIRKAYLEIAKANPKTHIVIDANQDSNVVSNIITEHIKTSFL